MRMNKTFQRAAALLAVVSMALSMSVAAFAGTYYIDYGDITITKNEDGSQTITQGNETWTDKAGEETIITTTSQAISTMEETDENHPVADIVLEPVEAEPEENQPVESAEDKTEEPEQPEENTDGADDSEEADGEENTEENTEPEAPAEEPEQGEEKLPEDTAQPEIATLESDDVTAPVDTQADSKQPVNDKGNGFWGNVITIINNFKDTVANVTIRDVKIDVSDTGTSNNLGKAAISIQGDGNVELELDGNNELKSGYSRAGVEKNDEDGKGNLTIKDDNGNAGSLTTTGHQYGGAGIGAKTSANTSNITITGGTVMANAGGHGAGIGSGGGMGGDASNITITGGTITAKGGNFNGAGIGGGHMGSGKNIKISGGTVVAIGSTNNAGIGGGTSGGNGVDIEISGGDVTAIGGDHGAGIGGGWCGNGENITISGGTVKATGGIGGAGIGGGIRSNNYGGIGSNITISGAAKVTAEAGKSDNSFGAGASIGNGGELYGAAGAGGVGTADISGLYKGDANIDVSSDRYNGGYVHHIDADGNEAWEYGTVPAPVPDEPETETPAAENMPLHVENLFGTELAYTTVRDGGTLTLTVIDAFARLHGSLAAVRELQAQGVNTIVFVTSMQTTTVSVSDLLARGADEDEFALRHDGVLSTLGVGNEVLAVPCAK